MDELMVLANKPTRADPMSRHYLHPNKLTLSERLLRFEYFLLVSGFALMVVGGFLFEPKIVGGIAVFLAWCEMLRRKRDPGPLSNVHGQAHFATDDEIAAAGMSGRSDGLIIGALPPRAKPNGIFALQVIRARIRETEKLRAMFYGLVFKQVSSRRYVVPRLLRLPGSDKMSHVACYMPTGVGKTWGVVIPNLLAFDENAVVYDPSGESFRETAEFRRKHFGHEVPLIDPYGVCGGVPSDCVNVFDLIGPDDAGVYDYCQHQANALVVEKPNSNQDPIWHKGTVSCTSFLLHSIARNARGKHRSLLSLGELLSDKQLHGLAKSYDNHPDDALRRSAQYMLNFQGKTLQSLLACTSAEHAWMNSPSFSQALSDSTFDVRNLQRRKMTLYVVIPGHRTLESRPFVRTVLTAILYAAFEAGPDIRRPPLRFYLDEIATLGQMDLLMTLYTQGRKFGLRSINFFQSVGQVADITGGPEKVQNFRSQMAAELWKPKDFQSAKEVSDWIGTTTVQTRGTSWQHGTNTGWSHSQGSQSSQGRSGGTNESSTATYNETGVPAIRPEEILQLREREAIFVSAGTPPVKVNVISAHEAHDFKDVTTTRQHQKRYLFRIRCCAAVLLPVAASSVVGGLLAVAAGWEPWSRQGFMAGGEQQPRPAVIVPQQVEQVRRIQRAQRAWQYRQQEEEW